MRTRAGRPCRQSRRPGASTVSPASPPSAAPPRLIPQRSSPATPFTHGDLPMNRRLFLKSSAAAAAVQALPWGSALAAIEGWRGYEITTRVEISRPRGISRAWVPLPAVDDGNWQKVVGNAWKGNASRTEVMSDGKYGVSMLYAEWPAGTAAPVIEVTSQVETRDRLIAFARPDPAIDLAKADREFYTAPTDLIPTEGLVKKTALEIVKGARTDVDKGRAIYEWIVENTFRDPKTRGCGIGDIKALLETGYLGGKCADVNALFVGMVRAAGIPARDIYGVRVIESAEYKSLGRGGDISKGQHCRAEFYSAAYGWVPVDPADVRKLVLEENGGTPLSDP